MAKAYQIDDQKEAYYMTFTVVGWADVFTRQIYRDIIIESFDYCRKEKGMLLYAYVVMSNHVHVVMESARGDLSGLVRDFKKHTSKRILKEVQENSIESRRDWLLTVFEYHAKYNKKNGKYQLWTNDNHAVEMSRNGVIKTKIDYIHNNPVRAGWVQKEEEYLYSSASNYYGNGGLIAIDFV